MIQLNENIANIPKGSALEGMYNRLVAGLEKASQESLPDLTGPEYVHVAEDGSGLLLLDKDVFPFTFESSIVDEAKINATIKEYENISRKNSAYLLANATVTSLGIGDKGGISGAVSLNGDSMLGKLNTLYGFTSGANGIKILDVYQTTEEDPSGRTSIVSIDGELHLNSHGLYINGHNVLDHNNDALSLNANNIKLNGDVTCSGVIRLDKLTISKDGINYNNLEFYHSGNSNRKEVDWTMRNGHIYSSLTVEGSSTFKSTVSAVNGVTLGYNNAGVFAITKANLAQLTGTLNIISGSIQFNGNNIIHIKNEKVVSFSAANKILNLGDDGTLKITLQSGIYDDDGEYELISKFGAAYFPESFKAGHGLGNTLMTTYKVSAENSGVIFHRHLKFVENGGPGFHSDGETLIFEGPFRYNDTPEHGSSQLTERHNTSLGYKISTSLYAPANRVSASMVFTTDADFYVFDKPLEGKKSLGISGSKTRILENTLFFNDNIYWLATGDGVKHYGHAYFNGDIGSVTFSSGFAGSGWKIYKNGLTGNICATFDEVTVRKKMRIYEFEVQKHSATNGAMWISDSCSGDIVEEIL